MSNDAPFAADRWRERLASPACGEVLTLFPWHHDPRIGDQNLSFRLRDFPDDIRCIGGNIPYSPARLRAQRANARRCPLIWSSRDLMYAQISQRTGAVLLAVGILDGAVTFVRFSVAGPYPAAFDGTAIVAGILLLRGGPRAALWVRTLAIFALTAGVVAVVALPLYQPLDLTFTEIRLDLAGFAIKAGSIGFALGILTWVSRELGRKAVQDAIASAGITRWDMHIPAQAGGGLIALAFLLLWLALHGQTAALAESLASQQLGPDYRYHLSWISSGNNGHGTTVSGVVTAWNNKEIKTVLLHWETR